jgi:release factor glutamine methyltransferase
LNYTVKKIFNLTWQPLVRRYLRKERMYRSQGIRVIIPQGVFHPGFFFSTAFLLHELKQIELTGKQVLELGAGSGLLSLYAASRGAIVTASDINPSPLRAIERSRELNKISGASLHTVLSDLFNKIPLTHFDLILINPPYYPKNPITPADHAWYCGEDHNYFRRLFTGLRQHVQPRTRCLMVLADECDIPRITELAKDSGIELKRVRDRSFLWERNYIYAVEIAR